MAAKRLKYDANEVWEFYSRFGEVNGIGEMSVGKDGHFDPKGKVAIHVTFSKLNRGTKIASVPREFKGCPIAPEVIGKIVPLRAK